MSQISPCTPVIIGAAQFTERLTDVDYAGLSPVDITARAALLALKDTQKNALRDHIDMIMTARTFEDSTPMLAFPHGRASNFPQAVASRLSLSPKRAVWSVSGGDSPQKMVAEACEAIAAGSQKAVLVCGGEAMSTAGALLKSGSRVDWSEACGEPVEDRGDGIDYVDMEELRHGLITPPLFHGMIENACRGCHGMTVDVWRARMAELFAPLSAKAAENPLSCQLGIAYTASQLASIETDNRLIAHPYPQRLIARDKVNQSAAVCIVSTALANELGVSPERRIYLRGYAHGRERNLIERPDVGRARSAGLVLKNAMHNAGVTLADIDAFDFYSCFPVAVSNAIEAIDLSPNDPRGLTVTGGLPYFGGPGNNYSLHAIAEMAHILWRGATNGLVAANGGFLSKYAVGVYSSEPCEFEPCSSAEVDKAMAEERSPAYEHQPKGAGTIETYTVDYHRDGSAKTAIVMGRLNNSGARFLAVSAPDDATTAQRIANEEALGRRIQVIANDAANTFTLID